MFTAEFIVLVAKWVFILFGVFVILCGLLVKSKDTNVDNDPTHFPPVPPVL